MNKDARFVSGKPHLFAEGYISGPLWRIRVRFLGNLSEDDLSEEVYYVIASTYEEAIDTLSEHYGEMLIRGIDCLADDIWLSSIAHKAIAEDVMIDK